MIDDYTCHPPSGFGPRSIVREYPPRACAPEQFVALMADALVRATRFDGLDLDDALAAEVTLIGAGFAPLDADRHVAAAAANARAQRRRAALLDTAGTASSLGSLVLVGTAVTSLLCPPAHAAAADAMLTDEHLFSYFTCAPIIIGALLVLAFLLRERVGRRGEAEDEVDVETGHQLTPERLRREADRG